MSRFAWRLSFALLVACQRESVAPVADAHAKPAAAASPDAGTQRAIDLSAKMSAYDLQHACAEELSQIERDLKTARQCTTAADCAVYFLNCPFSCFTPFNEHIMTERKVAKRATAQRKHCQRCDFRCKDPPNLPLECKDGTCQYADAPPVAPATESKRHKPKRQKRTPPL